ncbi:hypothetical protein V6N13_028083 [Hibiscus sabdariffa]
MIIRGILSQYSSASGQLINFDKSDIFFSSNVDIRNRQDVYRILGVQSTTNPEKYLGLPPIIGKNKKAAFADIHGKFIKRSVGLSSRMLSAGGKELESVMAQFW